MHDGEKAIIGFLILLLFYVLWNLCGVWVAKALDLRGQEGIKAGKNIFFFPLFIVFFILTVTWLPTLEGLFSETGIMVTFFDAR